MYTEGKRIERKEERGKAFFPRLYVINADSRLGGRGARENEKKEKLLKTYAIILA